MLLLHDCYIIIFNFQKPALNTMEGSNQSEHKPNREELTWDEKQDARSKGFIKSVKGGVMNEGHDANDDADETSQKRQDHEGAGGV